MSASTEQLVKWLHLHKDPYILIRWLCQRGLDYKALCHELQQIKSLWCQTHGDNTVKESETYKSGVQRIDRYLNSMDRSINKRVTNFLNLPFCQQRHLQDTGKLSNYTSCTQIDSMLNDLVVLPPYIQGLQVTCRPIAAKNTSNVHDCAEVAESVQPASTFSHCDTSASTQTQTARAPSKGRKRRRTSSPDSASTHKVVHNAQVQARIPAAKTVDMHAQLPKMLEVLKYSRAKPFELACALAFMSGRSLAEVMATGQFSRSLPVCGLPSSCPNVIFSLKTADPNSHYTVPLLCEASSFLTGVHRLRRMTGVEANSCKEINKSHCKTANTAAKSVLCSSSAVFSDLRAAYAALTFAQYGQKGKSNGDQLRINTDMKDWINECMPLASVTKAAAFRAKCCSTYLEMQLRKSSNLPLSTEVAAQSVQAAAPGHAAGSADEDNSRWKRDLLHLLLPLVVHHELKKDCAARATCMP